MTGERDELPPGARVRVRTRFGWAMTGELQVSGRGVVRVYDPAIEGFVRLGADDVVDLVAVDCEA